MRMCSQDGGHPWIEKMLTKQRNNVYVSADQIYTPNPKPDFIFMTDTQVYSNIYSLLEKKESIWIYSNIHSLGLPWWPSG